jgi:hypothetical protein
MFGQMSISDVSSRQWPLQQFYRKTVALGPIVKIARNAGATNRV